MSTHFIVHPPVMLNLIVIQIPIPSEEIQTTLGGTRQPFPANSTAHRRTHVQTEISGSLVVLVVLVLESLGIVPRVGLPPYFQILINLVLIYSRSECGCNSKREQVQINANLFCSSVDCTRGTGNLHNPAAAEDSRPRSSLSPHWALTPLFVL